MLTGESNAVLGTPCSGLGSKAAWSPDSKSVVISGAHLPLTADKPAEREERKAQTFLVEVRIPSREFVAISKENLRLVKWDARTGSVVCEKNQNSAGKGPSEVFFRKDREKWLEGSAPEKKAPSLPEIALDEDMNNAPQMVVVDPASGRRSLVMDLNPQFKYLTFAKVENIIWTDKLGNRVSGGLYWPPNYVPGKRYPLIIQTHGWNAAKFWIDGPFATAFAAQALTNKGFFVLQDPGPDWHALETPDEGPRATASYEGAIDYLDGRQLIDRKRVGIVGFSRTCYHVTFALTHSKYQFAAAVIADGIDAGYFQHLVFSNAIPDVATDSDALNGAAPFGEGLGDWIRRAPPFLADTVRTPLLIQAIGPASLLGEWEWFARLTRINRSVDLIYIPHGTHLLEKPWERMLSEQSSVDWFCFWLQREEDSDPARTEQYKRWRELREMQSKNDRKSGSRHSASN